VKKPTRPALCPSYPPSNGFQIPICSFITVTYSLGGTSTWMLFVYLIGGFILLSWFIICFLISLLQSRRSVVSADKVLLKENVVADREQEMTDE